MKSLAEKIIKANKAKCKGVCNTEIVDYVPDKDFSLFGYSEVILMNDERYKFVNSEAKSARGLKGSCSDSERVDLNQRLANARAKTKVKRLIVENNLKYHVCTTYHDPKNGSIEKRNEVLIDNVNFIKRLSYHQGKKIKYVGVPEIQAERFKKYGDKVMHMHVAIPGRIEIRKLWSAWNNKRCMKCTRYTGKRYKFECGSCEYFKGVVYIKNRKADKFKIGNYFGKYFAKGFDDKDLNQRTFGKKRYLRSNGLKMPKKRGKLLNIKEKEAVKKWSDFDKEMTKEVHFCFIKTPILNGILKGEIS